MEVRGNITDQKLAKQDYPSNQIKINIDIVAHKQHNIEITQLWA